MEIRKYQSKDCDAMEDGIIIGFGDIAGKAILTGFMSIRIIRGREWRRLFAINWKALQET